MLAKTQSDIEALPLLPSNSTSRDVLEALSQMVETQKLTVGDRLPPEVELARRLGIGRSKVREALTAWQNMGIVVRNKKAGTRLAAEVSTNSIHLPVTVKLEAESLLRTHAVRRPLEIEAVRLAALNGSVKDGRTIMARVADLLEVYEADEDWRQADYRFHAALQDACGNPLFGHLIAQIQQAFKEVYEAPFGRAYLGQDSIPLHLPLAKAVVAHDASLSVRLMEQILDLVEAEIRQVMELQNG